MYWSSRTSTPSQNEIFCLIACLYTRRERIFHFGRVCWSWKAITYIQAERTRALRQNISGQYIHTSRENDIHIYVILLYYCRYNAATGLFTVPTGRGGLYHFLTYLDTIPGNYAVFHISKFPKDKLCTIDGDNTIGIEDHDNVACGVTTNLNEGNVSDRIISNN